MKKLALFLVLCLLSAFGVDVYKRQGKHHVFALNIRLFSSGVHEPVYFRGGWKIHLVAHYQAPVSYTHLDVYKRQTLYLADMWLMQNPLWVFSVWT